VIPFGSYRLGVQRPDSDLDLLALAPASVCTRRDFFTSLVKLLAEHRNVRQVHPIPTAYTPVIKFVVKLKRVELPVDLVFARTRNTAKLLAYQEERRQRQRAEQQGSSLEPLLYHLDDSDLQGQDEAGVRSINGARVSQILLETVPHLRVFRTVLRAVKEWAVQNGIYSNVLGFLGGINWAILVAAVCKNHPTEKDDMLLSIFFRTYAAWNWPNPVMLTEIQDTPPVVVTGPPGRPTTESVVRLPAWNPEENRRDGLHVMPIITPAYPSMNSSYNVGLPQLRRIQEEMIRASKLLQEYSQDNHKNRNIRECYRALFSKSDFFTRYTHFLQVNIQALNHQDFVEWFRLVESRIRLLIVAVETPYVQAYPFAQFFDPHNGKYECSFFLALRFGPREDEVDMRYVAADFLHKVNTWEYRKSGMNLGLNHVLADELPSFLWREMGQDERDRVDAQDSGASPTTVAGAAPVQVDSKDKNCQ
jgi:poly(A) polymerase